MVDLPGTLASTTGGGIDGRRRHRYRRHHKYLVRSNRLFILFVRRSRQYAVWLAAGILSFHAVCVEGKRLYRLDGGVELVSRTSAPGRPRYHQSICPGILDPGCRSGKLANHICSISHSERATLVQTPLT